MIRLILNTHQKKVSFIIFSKGLKMDHHTKVHTILVTISNVNINKFLKNDYIIMKSLLLINQDKFLDNQFVRLLVVTAILEMKIVLLTTKLQ